MNEHTVYLRTLDLIIENTKFGYVVSGKIPKCLVNSVSEMQVGLTSPIIQKEGVVSTACHFIGY